MSQEIENQIEIKIGENPQALFDQIISLKNELGTKKKTRKEMLMEIPEYNQFTQEIDRKKEMRRAIEADFDSNHFQLKNEIDILKEKIKVLTENLTIIAIKSLKEGNNLDIHAFIGGKKRAIVVQYSAKFKQMSLF